VFGSVIAFVAYFTLLKRVGAGPSAYVSILTPVIAMLLSTLVEGYRWNLVAGFGVLLAVLGNWIALRPPAASAPAEHDPPTRA
jgi:drug/metabolite transporter (DMT)-like permease